MPVVKTLTPSEAAYVAGIIDGEGTVTLTKRHRNEMRQIVVSISNTEKPLLTHILNLVGAGNITGKRTYKQHHSVGYTYSISNRQALDLLRQAQPFLKTYKAKRSQLVLDYYLRLTPRNGKYTSELLIRREEFIEHFFSITPQTD